MGKIVGFDIAPVQEPDGSVKNIAELHIELDKNMTLVITLDEQDIKLLETSISFLKSMGEDEVAETSS